MGLLINNVKLDSMNATELKKIAKDSKVPKWWILNKQDLMKGITKLLVISKMPNGEKHLKLDEETQVYLDSGKEITQCKPGRAWREEPPTQKSALKAPPRKKTTKKKTPVKKSTPKRHNPEVITLKQICDDLGVSSYKARKHLRFIKLKKPGKQWAWDKSQAREISKIKDIIKGI